MKKKHIVCFGDSNTHGYRASNDSRYDEQERWTCLLQKQLGDDYLIIEEGLSGRTTCFPDPIHEGLSGLDYIYPCLMSHEPVDLLVIMLGTNDTKERFGASATCIALGLKRLIAKAASISDAWQMGFRNLPSLFLPRCPLLLQSSGSWLNYQNMLPFLFSLVSIIHFPTGTSELKESQVLLSQF